MKAKAIKQIVIKTKPKKPAAADFFAINNFRERRSKKIYGILQLKKFLCCCTNSWEKVEKVGSSFLNQGQENDVICDSGETKEVFFCQADKS